MYSLYSLLLTLGLLILLPRFLFDGVRHGKYIAGLSQRLGRLPETGTPERSLVWLHCVSVGETQAARPLVKALRDQLPHLKLVISTTTLTGQNVAREVFKEQAEAVIYFPFDWRWTVRRALKTINPRAVLLMETEVWPNFLNECRRAQIPVAIVNGRLSETSFRRYRFVKKFIARVLSNLDLALMQTDADARRTLALGLDPNKIAVSGNLKFDAGAMRVTSHVASQLKTRFGLAGEASVILAASTHAPEEQIILQAFKQMRRTDPSVRLILAPRHPERFEQIASLLDSAGLPWARRSQPASETDRTAAVILLDTIGELPAVYSLAAIVFVGGSIAKTGGHNILEPAAFGSCIITGFHTYNFSEIVRTFVEAGAVLQLSQVSEADAANELEKLFTGLLADEIQREEMGKRARVTMEKNVGATARTVQMLMPMLDRRQAPKSPLSQISIESAPLA
ncbi:MAG TPA: 3-deoxy-D-manno-octulosonic acid transferase [Pyrinomonadaceae bacterium]|nr:3-deoxy-D-manno-octulosonic acid transferase [Pyrinomonadaceae bacterium]